MNFKRLAAFLLLISFAVCIFSCKNDVQEKKTLVWIEEKSYFNGYRLTDNGTVIFDYAICFHNYSEDDLEVSLQTQNKKSELESWIEYEKFYEGKNNGEMYSLIPALSEVVINYSFEGKYLSEIVPNSISFPEEFIIATKIIEK